MRAKHLEAAATLIDGRVAALEAEYETAKLRQSSETNAADRAAILEAQHCARLIRALAIAPHRNAHPYAVANQRWSSGELARHEGIRRRTEKDRAA